MIVEIKNLVKYYGDFKAVDNLNLEVKENEILGLLGPNGSGKTTTINCLLSLLSYKEGEIQIFNQNMHPSAYAIKKDIGVVFQNVAVFDELNTYQNIDYFCGLYISNKAKRKQLVKEALEFVGIQEHAKKYPKELSGGLLRRLNIACGIAHKPKLIILDEPTVAVDPQSRNHILENIKQLKEQGATIIYTTHYMEEVEQICDRIVIMDNGRIIAQGSKEQLKSSIAVREKIKFENAQLTQELIEEIKTWKEIGSVHAKNNTIEIEVLSNQGTLLQLLTLFKERHVSYEKVYSENPTLNDVFLEITGKELRD